LLVLLDCKEQLVLGQLVYKAAPAIKERLGQAEGRLGQREQPGSDHKEQQDTKAVQVLGFKAQRELAARDIRVVLDIKAAQAS
jgi:hypothetical protein